MSTDIRITDSHCHLDFPDFDASVTMWSPAHLRRA